MMSGNWNALSSPVSMAGDIGSPGGDHILPRHNEVFTGRVVTALRIGMVLQSSSLPYKWPVILGCPALAAKPDQHPRHSPICAFRRHCDIGLAVAVLLPRLRCSHPTQIRRIYRVA
jgi:hypothetical protein